MQNAECRMRNAECRMRNAECGMLNAEFTPDLFQGTMHNWECACRRKLNTYYLTLIAYLTGTGARDGASVGVFRLPFLPSSVTGQRSRLSGMV